MPTLSPTSVVKEGRPVTERADRAGDGEDEVADEGPARADRLAGVRVGDLDAHDPLARRRALDPGEVEVVDEEHGDADELDRQQRAGPLGTDRVAVRIGERAATLRGLDH